MQLHSSGDAWDTSCSVLQVTALAVSWWRPFPLGSSSTSEGSAYFQIAPCFRDEDPRADRLYGDFYQLDLEMSFVDNGEIVRETIEPLFIDLATKFADKKLVMRSEPAKQFIVDNSSLPRIPYNFAMNTYGVDKPDLRYGMELIDLTDVFKDTDFKVFKQPSIKALCVKDGAKLTRREIDEFTEKARKLGAGGLAYI